MDRKNNKESGVLVIEAIVSLSIFMFALLSVLVIANVYTVQAKVQLAINSTAREISKYSYVLSMTGVQSLESELNKNGQPANQKTSNALDAVGELTSSITNLFTDKEQYLSGDGLSNLTGNVSNIQNAVQSGKNAYNDITSDPSSYLNSLASYLTGQGINFVQNEIIKGIVKPLVKQHLTNYRGGDVDSYLKTLGVVNGFSGIDFSGTRFYEDGNPELLIVATYQVKITKFLPIDLTYRIEQVAHTNCWTIAGEDKIYNPANNKNQATQKSQWESGAYKESENQFYTNLESEGYSRVEDTDIKVLYNPDTRDFKSITFHNPLTNEIDVENVDREFIKQYLQSQVNGFSFLEDDTVNLAGPTYSGSYGTMMSQSSLVIVVPEDKGLKEIYESCLSEINLPSSLSVKIETGFGTAKVKQETQTPSQEASAE